jgi:hypothetical protein
MKTLLPALALLAGCATAPTTTTRVPVPVECRETVPDRPVMPTEQIAAKPTLDQWIQSAMAELLRREAYEVKLRTALVACTAPISPGAPP